MKNMQNRKKKRPRAKLWETLKSEKKIKKKKEKNPLRQKQGLIKSTGT